MARAPHDALTFRVLERGTAGNKFSVQIKDSGAGSPNTVALEGNILTFNVDVTSGFTAQDAITLLAGDATLSAAFEATLDSFADPGNNGGSNLAVSAPVAFSGGRGAAETLGDVLELINNHTDNTGGAARVTAQLADVGNGISLVSDGLDGQFDLTVLAAVGSQAAEDLGLVGFQGSVSAAPVPGTSASVTINGADPNDAFFIRTLQVGQAGNDFQVEITDSGVPGGNTVSLNGNLLTFNVDIAGGFTAQNAIDLLAATPGLNTQFTAQRDTLSDPGNSGNGPLAVAGPLDFSGGVPETLTGGDANPEQVSGIFNALIRLRDALETDDLPGILQGIDLLDEAIEGTNFARAELGARQQGLDVLSDRLDTEENELTATLSAERDVDLVEAISELTARQASFEASLRTLAQTNQLSLLNFL